MAPEPPVKPDDEGKKVVDHTGTKIGRLLEVDNDRLWVDPNPSLLATFKSKMGVGRRTDSSYTVDASDVDIITLDAVQVDSL